MIHVGVVGCGYWGPNLIRNFNALANCEVKWACDLDAQRLARVKQTYPNVGVTTHIETLTEDPDIDAIAIATSLPTHFELAKLSLLGGKHTFVEKPIARTTAQCEWLMDKAVNESVLLMVGHTFIYNPAVRKMKELIDSGEIGEVLYISSRRLNLGLFQKDVNVAWDLAPHDLAIILYLLGKNPHSVSCHGKAYITPGVEDVTNMSLNFGNGEFATIQNSWLDPNKVRLMTVVGTAGMIVYDDTEPLEKIKIHDKRVKAPRHFDGLGEFQFAYHYGGTRSPYVAQEEPLRVQCGHFVECIEQSSPPQTSGIEGLQVVKILEAASESLKDNGRFIKLSPVFESAA